MTKLNYKVWNVETWNDDLIVWAVEDLSSWITNSFQAWVNTISPSVKLAIENTIQLWRRWDTLFKKENWWKWIKSLWAIPADIITKAASLPFRTIDKAIEYVISNNIERTVEWVKWVTTSLVANLITNNWKTRFKTLQFLWTWIEWTWDLIWWAIKLTPLALWKLFNLPSKYIFDPAIKHTQKWVENQRISDKDFIPQLTNLWTNSDYTPTNQLNSETA